MADENNLYKLMEMTEEGLKTGEADEKAGGDMEQKFRATEGDITARKKLKEAIDGFLETAGIYEEKNIKELLGLYHIDYCINIFTGGKDIVLNPIDSEIAFYFEKFRLKEIENGISIRQKLVQILYQEIYGYGILDELIFEGDFDEVAANRYDYIWVQYKGIKRKIPNTEFKFKNNESYYRIIENRLTANAGEEMNAGEPIIYSYLLDGTRITALRPPLSKNYVVNARIFKPHKNVTGQGFMDEGIAEIIRVLTKKGRRNIMVIGEQGSGKTTAAEELVIRHLGDDTAIGLAENVHELNLSDKYPQKNVVELQYTKNFSPSELTEIFFRLNRDIVIFGEVRSSNEAFEVIKAMLRQARGSLFTFHSSSVKRSVHDLRQLLMQTGFYTDYREAQFDVADAVDLVMHIKLSRETGQRYVYKVCEIIADEKDMSFKVNDLFTYDRDMGMYIAGIEGLSNSMVLSCMEYELTNSDLKHIENIYKSYMHNCENGG